jgi:MFS family permease
VVGVILTDMVELRNRGKVTGLFALSNFLGLPGGLVLGGAIAENTSWRW